VDFCCRVEGDPGACDIGLPGDVHFFCEEMGDGDCKKWDGGGVIQRIVCGEWVKNKDIS